MSKGFTPVDLDIHENLNYDNDLIIKCLFYIVSEIPNI
jgi:hypothetical protein